MITYITYHLLREPETAIDRRFTFPGSLKFTVIFLAPLPWLPPQQCHLWQSRRCPAVRDGWRARALQEGLTYVVDGWNPVCPIVYRVSAPSQVVGNGISAINSIPPQEKETSSTQKCPLEWQYVSSKEGRTRAGQGAFRVESWVRTDLLVTYCTYIRYFMTYSIYLYVNKHFVENIIKWSKRSCKWIHSFSLVDLTKATLGGWISKTHVRHEKR